jgi:tetratricopeptide (TPR) repeat protein
MNRLSERLLKTIWLCLLGFSLALCAEPDRWQSLIDAGNSAMQKHQYLAAKKDGDAALRESERAGFDDPRISKSFKFIGDVYFAQQKYDESKPYYSRAQMMESYIRNQQYVESAYSLGDYAGAKSNAEMNLKQAESAVGSNDVLLTPALISLGKAEKALMQEPDAEATLKRAIKILEPAAPDSTELASALDLLGGVYDDEKKYGDAEPLLKQALSLRQKILPEDDPAIESSFEHLAAHCTGLGHIDDAETYRKQAGEIQEKGLMDRKDYVDTANGFRLQVPKSWSSHSDKMSLPVPGSLVTIESVDHNNVVLVQRIPTRATVDSSAYDSFGQLISAASRSSDQSEENVLLSGLPARKISLSIALGKKRATDWMVLIATPEELWALHVIGPQDEMDSTDGPYGRAAEGIIESFSFLDPVLPVLKTQALVPPPPLATVTGDSTHCRRYENREVAMQILLPDGWHQSEQNSPASGDGKIVILSRTGTLAVLILGRETLEASPELYLKSLKNNLRQQTEDFKEVSETKVSSQAYGGTRIALATREDGIDYREILEVFSAGNEHYRLVAKAPAEVFDRYSSAFEDMLQSVQILQVAGQPTPDNLMPAQPSAAP